MDHFLPFFSDTKSVSLHKQLYKIAASPHALLLTGESGTGKSSLAKSVHNASQRSKHAFVEISCASIPANLLESELFGYKKGAFSGAFKDKVGLLEKADGGTLFLDEIAEMPIELQPKLLLFLQTQRFYPVGSIDQKQVDVRLIAATNQNLQEAMQQARFRQDLYYRLSVFEVELPPLRKRTQDIPILAVQFLREALLQSAEAEYDPPRFTGDALDQLLMYEWPGNIRELRNVMLRVATLLESSESVEPRHLPSISTAKEAIESKPTLLHSDTNMNVSLYDLSGKTLREVECAAVCAALDASGGKRAAAAKQLGVSEKTIYNLIKRYQI